MRMNEYYVFFKFGVKLNQNLIQVLDNKYIVLDQLVVSQKFNGVIGMFMYCFGILFNFYVDRSRVCGC